MNARPLDRRRSCSPASGPTVALCAFTIAVGFGPLGLSASAPSTAIAGWCARTLRPTDTWNTLTVDMRVKQRRITKAGETTGAPSPAASYRIERSSRSGSWKTTVTVLSVDRAPMYSLSGALVPRAAFPVTRIEDDEDGTPVRAYGPRGALLRSVPLGSGGATLPRTVGTEWLDSFVATLNTKTTRQRAFEQVFGRATRYGTLNRYVRTVTDGTQEVLVDPRVVVPVEATAVRSGKMVGHRTISYGPAPDSALVRTAVHSETVVAADTGERAVVDTTFSRTCLERRR